MRFFNDIKYIKTGTPVAILIGVGHMIGFIILGGGI